MSPLSTNPALSGIKAKIGAGWDPTTGGVDESGMNLHQRSVAAEMDRLQKDAANPLGDPLGISRMQDAINLGNAQQSGGWSDWLQALKERAPGGVATPTKRGDPMPGLQEPGSTIFDPLRQTSAVDPGGALSALADYVHKRTRGAM